MKSVSSCDSKGYSFVILSHIKALDFFIRISSAVRKLPAK